MYIVVKSKKHYIRYKLPITYIQNATSQLINIVFQLFKATSKLFNIVSKPVAKSNTLLEDKTNVFI